MVSAAGGSENPASRARLGLPSPAGDVSLTCSARGRVPRWSARGRTPDTRSSSPIFVARGLIRARRLSGEGATSDHRPCPAQEGRVPARITHAAAKRPEYPRPSRMPGPRGPGIDDLGALPRTPSAEPSSIGRASHQRASPMLGPRDPSTRRRPFPSHERRERGARIRSSFEVRLNAEWRR